MRQPVWNPISDPGYDHTAVAVPDQCHVTKILIQDCVDDVSDVRFETDIGRRKVSAFSEPGQGYAKCLMPTRRKNVADWSPIPTPAPRAMHQHIGMRLSRLLSAKQNERSEGHDQYCEDESVKDRPISRLPNVRAKRGPTSGLRSSGGLGIARC